MTVPEDLEQLVHTWLGVDASRYLPLLRPAVELSPADPGDPVAGRLGGLPPLPADVDWPTTRRGRPLTFVVSVDLGAVAGCAGNLNLPVDGTLLFFTPDAHDWSDSFGEPNLGTVVRYVPAGTAVTDRAAPPDVEVFPLVPLTTGTIWTWPHAVDPAVVLEFGLAGALKLDNREHDGVCFADALWQYELRAQPDVKHYIGGYDRTGENPIAMVAAAADPRLESDGPADYDDPRFWARAATWLPLLRIAEDERADRMWGKEGAVQWAIHADDLSAGSFERTSCTV